jgi:hypothetical protein
MPCQDLSIDLKLDPPNGDCEVELILNKICNPDETVEWKLHFSFQKKDDSGTLKPVVTLDVDINHQDHPVAQATANNGMDANQRAQADLANQTALLKDQGQATADDVKQQTGAIIPARDPNSPA